METERRILRSTSILFAARFVAQLANFGFVILFAVGMVLAPTTSFSQESGETAQDTVEAVQDNSSSFNDSVQFDHMEPIFYEATEDEEPAPESGTSSIVLYVGIAIALLIILIVLKKVGKKKS